MLGKTSKAFFKKPLAFILPSWQKLYLRKNHICYRFLRDLSLHSAYELTNFIKPKPEYFYLKYYQVCSASQKQHIAMQMLTLTYLWTSSRGVSRPPIQAISISPKHLSLLFVTEEWNKSLFVEFQMFLIYFFQSWETALKKLGYSWTLSPVVKLLLTMS